MRITGLYAQFYLLVPHKDGHGHQLEIKRKTFFTANSYIAQSLGIVDIRS